MQRPLGVSRLELLRKAAACVGRYQEAFKRALAGEEAGVGINVSPQAGEGGEAAGKTAAAGAGVRFGRRREQVGEQGRKARQQQQQQHQEQQQ